MTETTPHPDAGGLAADLYGDTADPRPPIVLLHGLGGSRRHWTPVLDHLTGADPGRRVLAVDLPGHGDSPRRDSYRLDEVVASVRAAVDAAGLGAPVVAGHSISGVIATRYAATHPVSGVVNVDQILLAGPFRDFLLRAEPVLRGPGHGQVWRSLVDGMRTDLLPPAARDILAADPFPTAGLLLGYWAELMGTPAEDLVADRARDLAALRARGVAYHHIAAEELPAGYRSWLRDALPGVALTVLPGTGHFPHLGHPLEVARIVAEQGTGTGADR